MYSKVGKGNMKKRCLNSSNKKLKCNFATFIADNLRSGKLMRTIKVNMKAIRLPEATGRANLGRKKNDMA